MNETLTEPAGEPPGTYTLETLPQASPDVHALLDQLKVDARQLAAMPRKSGTAAPKDTTGEALAPADEGKPMLKPKDKGRRAIGLA